VLILVKKEPIMKQIIEFTAWHMQITRIFLRPVFRSIQIKIS